MFVRSESSRTMPNVSRSELLSCRKGLANRQLSHSPAPEKERGRRRLSSKSRGLPHFVSLLWKAWDSGSIYELHYAVPGCAFTSWRARRGR
jgi:hypothetical protein